MVDVGARGPEDESPSQPKAGAVAQCATMLLHAVVDGDRQVPTRRQSAHRSTGSAWHRGPRCSASPHVSRGLPMASHARAGPARAPSGRDVTAPRSPSRLRVSPTSPLVPCARKKQRTPRHSPLCGPLRYFRPPRMGAGSGATPWRSPARRSWVSRRGNACRIETHTAGRCRHTAQSQPAGDAGGPATRCDGGQVGSASLPS